MLLRCPKCLRIINDADKVAKMVDSVTLKKGVVCPNTNCKTQIWFKDKK